MVREKTEINYGVRLSRCRTIHIVYVVSATGLFSYLFVVGDILVFIFWCSSGQLKQRFKRRDGSFEYDGTILKCYTRSQTRSRLK